MYANTSWLSQTSWIPGESNDDGLQFRNELQAPKFRARAGMTYSEIKVFLLIWHINMTTKFMDMKGFTPVGFQKIL